MKTCTNISTVNWPAMAVAKAVRHSQYDPGYAFGLVLSTSAIGQRLEGYNTDGTIVSR